MDQFAMTAVDSAALLEITPADRETYADYIAMMVTDLSSDGVRFRERVMAGQEDHSHGVRIAAYARSRASAL
jgi:hypothetical protein